MADEDDNNGNIPYGWTASEEGISYYFVVYLTFLALVLVLSKFLHERPWLASILPEAGMTILVGIVGGAIVYYLSPDNADNDDDDYYNNVDQVADGLLSFSSTIFFVALLPPIIFNSGYHLRREIFFRHLVPIILFACIGTVISTVFIALLLYLAVYLNLTGSFEPTIAELLTFGALISATDPVSTLAVFQKKRVDPQLFYLVFGESVLNDAVGLVLFNAFAKFVGRPKTVERIAIAMLKFCLDFAISFVGSLSLGFASGILAGLLLKKVDMRHTPLLELSLYILLTYFPFFVAEVLDLSGIVTILFTGISARRYAQPNLSPQSDSNADGLFRLAAHLAETGIFMELGMSVFGLSLYGNFHGYFILWAILGCLLGRVVNVYPITFLFNRSLRQSKNRNKFRDQKTKAVTTKGSMTSIGEEKSDAVNDDDDDNIDYSVSDVSHQSQTPHYKQDMKISWETAHMLYYSGLRGAVAYACAKSFPDALGHRTSFVITTMTIVLVTVFVLGGTTAVVLKVLDIDMDVDEDKYMDDQELYMNAMRAGRKLGKIVEFEENIILPCVLRQEVEEATAADDSSTMISPTSHFGRTRLSQISDRQLMSQSQNIEMTEAVHMGMVRQMGYMSSDVRTRTSVYDYGGSSTRKIWDSNF